MTIADIQKIAAEAVANAMRLTTTAAAPKPTAAKKRTLSAEQKAKMAAGRERARAAKAKPATPKVERPAKVEAGVVRIGAVEVVPYDGGVVVRPVGRRRGVAFRKGEWKMFAAFCNTIRSADCTKIGEAVAAHIGR